MCSEAPSRSRGLAQDIDEETRDGPLTFDEALVYTEGLKLVTMDHPIIVDKETSDCCGNTLKYFSKSTKI